MPSPLFELDMKWPEYGAQGSTHVLRRYMPPRVAREADDEEFGRGTKVWRCREVDMGFALVNDEAGRCWVEKMGRNLPGGSDA